MLSRIVLGKGGAEAESVYFQWKFRSIFDVRDHLISQFRETVPFCQRALTAIRTEDESAASALIKVERNNGELCVF